MSTRKPTSEPTLPGGGAGGGSVGRVRVGGGGAAPGSGSGAASGAASGASSGAPLPAAEIPVHPTTRSTMSDPAPEIEIRHEPPKFATPRSHHPPQIVGHMTRGQLFWTIAWAIVVAGLLVAGILLGVMAVLWTIGVGMIATRTTGCDGGGDGGGTLGC